MVQVIAIGYGRTGTASLTQALGLLGYETFNTKTMMLERPELLDVWYRNTTAVSALDACPLNLTEFLQGYTAATGMMFAVCLQQTLEAFPNAYYILNIRNSGGDAGAEDWFASWSTLMDSVSLLPRFAPWLPRAKQIDYYNRWLMSHVHQQDETFLTTKNHPIQQNAVVAQQSYLQHIETVRELIPSYQLLELPMGSGWDPLCGFLNVSVPPEGMAYPHANSSQTLIWQCRLTVLAANLLLLLALFGLTKIIGRLTPQTKTKIVAVEVEPPAKGGSAGKMGKEEEEERAEEPEEEEEYVPNVKIIPEDDGTTTEEADPPYLLSMAQMQQLAAKALPPMVALRCWKRIYRLSRDGDDFGTFLNATKGHGQTLLVIQTTTKNHNQLFGAFADSPWDTSERENYNINMSSSGGFYGSTQTCLFTFEEKTTTTTTTTTTESQEGKKDDDDDDDDKPPLLAVFKWSGLNRYIQLFDIHTGRVAFGGGGGNSGNSNNNNESGSFGLCIEDNFSRGTSAPCDTFNNPLPLTGDADQQQFDIADVEIWTFARGTLG